MALWSDFKKFAFKGNVVDLAVGVIIGASFQKIVTALVGDVIMPTVTAVTPITAGNWREKSIVLKHAAEPAKDVKLLLGDFLGSILDFLIVAFILFLIVSRILKAAEKKFGLTDDTKKPETKECPFCLDLVAAKATRCKSCTSHFSDAAQPPTAPASP